MEDNKAHPASSTGKVENVAPWWITIIVIFVSAIGVWVKTIVSENNQNQKDFIARQDKYIQSLTIALNRSSDALLQVLNDKRNESINSYNIDSVNVFNTDKPSNAGNAKAGGK